MSSKSASLEELVRANKAQFDRIFSTQMGTPDAQTGDTAEPSETPASVAEDGQAPLDSSIRKILTERYGDGWSHEIVEHSIDGDEVRVVCRLEADGLTSTQHGNARSSGNVGIALQRASDNALARWIQTAPEQLTHLRRLRLQHLPCPRISCLPLLSV